MSRGYATIFASFTLKSFLRLQKFEIISHYAGLDYIIYSTLTQAYQTTEKCETLSTQKEQRTQVETKQSVQEQSLQLPIKSVKVLGQKISTTTTKQFDVETEAATDIAQADVTKATSDWAAQIPENVGLATGVGFKIFKLASVRFFIT